MTYSTVKHTTCNEDRKQEVEIGYERGFWRWVFRMPEYSKTYVSTDGIVWFEKRTGKRVGTLKECEIRDIITYFRNMNTPVRRWGSFRVYPSNQSKESYNV